MIELSTLIEIIVGIFVVGGSIVGFFVMQKGQNMKIAQLEKDMEVMKELHEKELKNLKETYEKELGEVKRKQSVSTSNQIQTEKEIVGINVKLAHILELLEKLEKSDKENHNGL